LPLAQLRQLQAWPFAFLGSGVEAQLKTKLVKPDLLKHRI